MNELEATELEALLRLTLGDLFVRTVGVNWQNSLSAGVRTSLEKTREVAARNRDGVGSDPWTTAGLREIRQVAESFAMDVYEGRADHSATDPDRLLNAGLKDLGWHTVAQCSADFQRLEAERHDDAHPGVVAPPASAVIEEVEAIRRRLRLGAEAVRRRLIGADEEWFPFIERVDCPHIPQWKYVRGRIFPEPAALGEGDEVEFVVSALNTDGSGTGLRYGLYVQPDGGGFVTIVDDDASGRLACVAGPPGRSVMFRIAVRALEGGHDASGWDDEVIFMARIKPTR
jgi:hypothetical protein